MTTRWKQGGTAIAATAWIAACGYLYFAWPSLTALIETLDRGHGVRRLVLLPRIAFLGFGLVAVLGLTVKDRWMSTAMALATDAVIGAPAFTLIAILLYPFFDAVE